MKRLIVLLNIIAFQLLISSCAKNPVTGKNDFMLMSKGQEVAMGQQSDPEIVNFFGVYKDDALQKFISEKGQKMASISHRKDLKYEFKIVDSPVVNAFAVPGGYVYFTRGIMAHFNNEAEFAGVLGHEIGHITARHSAKQYSRGMLAQVGLIAGMVLYPELAQFGDAAQTGISLLFLKYGRDAESQADKLGVEYSSKIGYDAQEMADFFRTLQRLQDQSKGEKVPTFLSTHPDPADREAKVAKMAADWKKKTKATALEVDRNRYLKMIDGIVYGEDPKQGFVEGNYFYHPVLKFKFGIPSQWSLQNSPQQVQMAEKNGKAVIIFTLAEGNSLDNAAQTLLTNYQLKVVDSKHENVNGLNAIAIIADQQQQQQQQQQSVRTLIYLIQYSGNIYAFIGASSPTDFKTYFETFQSSMNSFSALSDPDKLNRQPERIKIKTVNTKSSLQQVLRSYNTKDSRLEEVAILNGMALTDMVDKGMLIKVIEN
jgi:predicted Zn-dependent protease